MAMMKSGYTAENRGKCDAMIDENQEFGFCSPPLWKNLRPGPPKTPSLPLHNDKCISPNTRLQTIVRSQAELMELVKSMPESSFELSLTDLVENPRSDTQVPQLWGPDNDWDLRRRSQETKKSDRVTRTSASFENKGLLLKMFPVGLPSKRKKSLDKSVGGRSAELPKVSGERDWWKKRFTASTDSDSSRTSGGGSGSSDRSQDTIRKRNGVVGTSCWPLF